MVQDHPSYTFPEDDLVDALVKLYFEHVNILLPLLHRPSFERSIQEKLHLKDEGFAATVLLVCAVGSRWSDDPRIFLEGGTPNSCGWKWFGQVQVVRRSLLEPPTLYDLQFYCVRLLFLSESSYMNSFQPALCSFLGGDFGSPCLLDNGWYRYQIGPRCRRTSEETAKH